MGPPAPRQILLATLLATLLAAPLRAQEEPDSVPLVALVLGGGGARGLAHAGVLAGLEPLGFDPGLVVGTSMGAIMGALYAAGYDTHSIMELIRLEDWSETFAPMPELVGPLRQPRHPVLRRAVDLELGRFKGGFIPDWRINRLLTRLLLEPGARARGDFDRLPRRYRAVAASLITGRAVVLGEGDLARAVRASMAVPGVFSPVVLGDEVLVDGGIADYLPVAAARALGADRVVAVDVVLPPPDIQSTGPVDLAGRAVRLLLRNAGPEAAPPTVLLVPPIDPGYSSATFPRDAAPLLMAGLSAAGTVPPGALPEGGPGRRPALPLPDVLTGLVVAAPGPVTEAFVRTTLADALDAPFEPSRVLEGVDALYATGLFSGVWPHVDARERLVVSAELVPAASLLGGAGYHSERGLRGWVAFNRRHILAGAHAELELALSASPQERFATAAVRRLFPRRAGWALAAEAHALERDVRHLARGLVRGEGSVRRLGGWLGVEGRAIAPDLVATLGAVVEEVDHTAEDGVSAGVRAQLAATPPLTQVVGTPAGITLEGRAGELPYGQAEATGALTGRRGRVLLAVFASGAAVTADAPLDVWPTLGDGLPVPGLRWGEGRGRTRLVLGADAAVPFVLEGHLRLRLLGAHLGGSLAEPGLELERLGGLQLAGIWPTPLGPVELAAGANTARRWRVEVGVGPRF